MYNWSEFGVPNSGEVDDVRRVWFYHFLPNPRRPSSLLLELADPLPQSVEFNLFQSNTSAGGRAGVAFQQYLTCTDCARSSSSVVFRRLGDG